MHPRAMVILTAMSPSRRDVLAAWVAGPVAAAQFVFVVALLLRFDIWVDPAAIWFLGLIAADSAVLGWAFVETLRIGESQQLGSRGCAIALLILAVAGVGSAALTTIGILHAVWASPRKVDRLNYAAALRRAEAISYSTGLQ